MARVCFIRHGESLANAGAKSTDPASIGLTQKGHEQAKEISRSFQKAPILIVTSPYIRTKQTAQPTLERFQNVASEEWDIQEFTYLSPPKYRNTTLLDRFPAANAYWTKGDPSHKDGEGAESFIEFVERCGRAIDKCRKKDGGLIFAFSHEQFIAGVIWYMEGRLSKPSKKTMHDFRAYLMTKPVKNCGIVEFDL